MQDIKLAYSDLYNAGDLMNIDIVEKLSGSRVVKSKTYCADMTAIGGALIGIQYSERVSQRTFQRMLRIIYGKKPIYIWGSGFLHDYNNNGFYRDNFVVCALRGAKSQKKMRDLTGKFFDVPLADGGLLIDMLMNSIPKKKYRIGLIPHMWHQNEPAVIEMIGMEGIHLIDIKQPPQRVAYEIAQCESVISSSLHGLIFADALHVPNLHVLGDKELRGGNFKFEDYYSSYGLEDKYWLLSKKIPVYKEIIDSYQIQEAAVERKKKELIESFPKFELIRRS